LNSSAQKNVKSQNLSTNVKIIVDNLSLTKSKFDSLLKANNWITSTYNVSNYDFNASISFYDSTKFIELLSLTKTWGILMDETTSSYLSTSDAYSNYLSIESLKNERNQYEKLASKLDSTSVKYFEYWEKIIAIDKAITTYDLAYKLNPSNKTMFTLSMKFYEEEIIGSQYNDSWINMPGFEYSFLFTEQPKSGVSTGTMAGYSLKYMFNYRKSYLLLGLYKSSSAQLDTEINEIYTFALGQDFYSRKLGRGKRKFLNLYTSFNLGVMMASSETTKYNSWFANPFLGLEIFKTKHFLLDNKVGYFLPFANNRDQRGLLYNISFNFVF
jgi:hypothetical protein